MKKIIFSLLLSVLVTAAMAIPAKRVSRVVNINGKAVTLTLRGNESLHYWQADDGTAYQIADNDAVELFDVAKAKLGMQVRKTRQADAFRAVGNTPDGMKRASQMRRSIYTGTRRGLVILVNFKDKSFVTPNPLATYQDILSAQNYSGNGQNGSVRDYFYAQSYGQFDYEFDVVGPVTLSNNMSYYGGNDSDGNDKRPAQMAKEACQLANNAGVDFTVYDWDNDGYVEQVFIVYAGYGEAQGADSNTIWPHAWQIEGSGTTLTLDGKRISSYACGCELAGSSGSKIDGIGTICHEFSHCFGLPDFYDINYEHNQMTMAYWSLMDAGAYNNDGYCPAAYTAYERWFCGWIEPTELNDGCVVSGMTDINDSGEAYVIYNQANKNEYYLLQNIQKEGWNAGAYGHGMLVIHVDYDKNAWDNNSPNTDADHLRMAPVCADNAASVTASSLAGDPYPGTKKNRSLTDTSSPAATLFNANSDGRKYLGRPIEQITESDGTISFVFNGGVPPVHIDPVQNLHMVDSTEENFTVAWDAVSDAVSYTLEYGTYDVNGDDYSSPVQYLLQLFDFGLSIDNSTDVSTKLDQITDVSGYTGFKLFKGVSGLKFSSSSAKGYLITPTLAFEDEEVVVTLLANQYKTQEAVFTVSTIDDEGNIIDSKETNFIVGSDMEISLTLNAAGATKVRLDASARVYLAALAVNSVEYDPYDNVVTIEGITDTQLTVTPAVIAPTYSVKVLAVGSDGSESEWSDEILVNLQPTAITRPQSVITAAETLFSIDGRVVTHSATAPAGMYISHRNGKTVKIIKK